MGLFSRKKSTDTPRSDAGDKKTDDKSVKKPVEKKTEKKPVAKSVPKKEKKEVKETKVVKPAKKVDNKVAVAAYKVLVRPIISEKATVNASQNKYTFEVSATTNKVEIKKAIEEAYGVSPIAVNILNQRGKFVRFGRKTGRTKNIKKAVVTLKKGDSIKLYEGI